MSKTGIRILILVSGLFLSLIPFLPVRLGLMILWFCVNGVLLFIYLAKAWEEANTAIQILPGTLVTDILQETSKQQETDSTRSLVPAVVPEETVELLRHIREDLPQTCEIASKESEPLSESFVVLEQDSNEILANIDSTYELADNLSASAGQAFAKSEQLQQTVRQLESRITTINKLTENLILESEKITSIVEILSEISSRTHVLSINASIVSARAGTHGKGFAVIAQEIRRLAEETENSLSTIGALVTSFHSSIATVTEQNMVAGSEIQAQQDSLLAVAGALQGVQLSIEVIKTLSGSSRIKAADQKNISTEMKESFNRIMQASVLQKDRLESVRKMIEEHHSEIV